MGKELRKAVDRLVEINPQAPPDPQSTRDLVWLDEMPPTKLDEPREK
jgi:hypothetical protein